MHNNCNHRISNPYVAAAGLPFEYTAWGLLSNAGAAARSLGLAPAPMVSIPING